LHSAKRFVDKNSTIEDITTSITGIHLLLGRYRLNLALNFDWIHKKHWAKTTFKVVLAQFFLCIQSKLRAKFNLYLPGDSKE
jgi:hypothetical protein